MDPLLVSVDEAARALGMGRSLVYELLAAGEIASIKVGRRRLVPSRALAEWVEQRSLATAMATGAPRPPQK